MYDVNGRKHDFKTCLTWPAWQDLDKGRLQEVKDEMAELHTDDTFMYENCLVGDAADKSLADLIEEVYETSHHKQFMDALDKQPQQTEYFDSVWDAVHEKVDDDPMNTQVGGDHYRQGGIQPVEFIHSNNLGFCEGSIIKYVVRYKNKNGIEDLRKAKHYIELLIEMEFNNDD